MIKIRNVIILTILIILSLSQTTAITQKSDLVCNEIVKTRSFDSNISDMINLVNESLVRRYLEEQVAFGPRPTGSENCSRTADYLYNEFEKMGLNVEFDHFSFFRYKDKNIIATLNGSDSSSDAVFIICCHYDTWPGSPGANDDASGCAAILAIAKVMSQYSFNHTVKFILFSGHEQGAYGSTDYAQKAYYKDENIQGVLCPGSIGRPSKNGSIIQLSKSYRSDWIYYLTCDIAEEYKDELNVTVEPVPIWFCDNLPFTRYGFTSTTVIPGPSDIEDHCPEDDLDRINYSYLTTVTKLLLVTTICMANKPIDVQVRFVTPIEGFFYISDKICFKMPLKKSIAAYLQGMTYLLGKRIVARINITSEEKISNVIYSIDNEIKYSDVVTEPPFEWKIRRKTQHIPLLGRHSLEVTVTTTSGKTAYDEMDIFII